MNNNTIVIGDFNTLLISMDTLAGKKSIFLKPLPLKDILYQLDLVDIYRIVSPLIDQNLWLGVDDKKVKQRKRLIFPSLCREPQSP